MAAGLALGGHIVFTANAAPFLIGRANEQVKNDVCYSATNVKMIGLNAGVTYGPLASTHHAIDDISVMSGFGKVQILAPCDEVEAAQMVEYAASFDGPSTSGSTTRSSPSFMTLHTVSSRVVRMCWSKVRRSL